jgi:hypothetical protein
MRSYWMRILLGAAAIFAIGMVGVTLYRRGVVKVNQVVAGSGPLTIPLPFVPFELDGNRLGTVERLVVNRDAPKKVSSVDLEVKLDDSLVAQGLAGCRLAANIEGDSSSPKDFNVHVNRNSRPFFFCAGEDTSLVEFGTVTLNPGEVTVPLLIPESVADQLESGAWDHDGAADSADVMAAQAESLAGKAQKAADSIMKLPAVQAKLKDARLRGLADSLRKAGRLRADSMFREMADSESAR